MELFTSIEKLMLGNIVNIDQINHLPVFNSFFRSPVMRMSVVKYIYHKVSL